MTFAPDVARFDPAHLGTVSARPGQVSFGAPIGILLLDCVAPFIPGSVGNATTFSRPVRYKTVPGLTVDRVLSPQAAECERAVVDAAVQLVSEGARVITANCGFTARFQDAVRAAVDVPVLLSSLLQAPLLDRMLPQGQSLGILTASAASLTKEFLRSVGVTTDDDRVAIAGLDDAPAFTAGLIACVGEMDVAQVTDEVVGAAVELTTRYPDIGALLLECSEFPPYAAAIQHATGRPVFDFVTMIEFFAGGLARTPFTGMM
jgi:hypothetical protein